MRGWFVTGVSGGLGRAIAVEALRRGDTVVGTLRRPEQVEEFERLEPGRAFGEVLDVTEPDETVARVFQRALARAGAIDVVVNNAGYGLGGAVEEVSDAEARRVMDANVFGPLKVLRAALPHLRDRRRGHVVNVSSSAGNKGVPGFGVYSATKFALEGLSEALRAELAPFGIAVTIAVPGALRTNWAGSSLVRAERQLPGYDVAASVVDNVRRSQGSQPGDPERTARAIVDAVGRPDPPLRLVLGAAAYDGVLAKYRSAIEEVERWRDVSVSTDVDREEVAPHAGS